MESGGAVAAADPGRTCQVSFAEVTALPSSKFREAGRSVSLGGHTIGLAQVAAGESRRPLGVLSLTWTSQIYP